MLNQYSLTVSNTTINIIALANLIKLVIYLNKLNESTGTLNFKVQTHD